VLFLHSPAPERIGEGVAAGPGQWREGLSVKHTRLLEPGFPTGCHAMGVGNGRDGHGAGREAGALLDEAWRRWDDARSSAKRPPPP
jgi:hypothetical protein